MADDRRADDHPIVGDCRDRNCNLDRPLTTNLRRHLPATCSRIGSDRAPLGRLPELVHPDCRLSERLNPRSIAKNCSANCGASSPIAEWQSANGTDGHGWSLSWTGCALGPSSQDRRDMAFARRKAESRWRPQKATAGARLSDMGNSRDQTSRWQERASIPEKIFEREIMRRSAGCSRVHDTDEACRPAICLIVPDGRCLSSRNSLYR